MRSNTEDAFWSLQWIFVMLAVGMSLFQPAVLGMSACGSPGSTIRSQEKIMRVIHDDDDTVQFVDDAAISFMALTVHRLNAALKKGGVEDAAVRQEVCSSFIFEFAYHHDAGWLAKDGKKLYPMVVFAERREPKQGENLGEIAELHVPTQATSWHEYALGVASRYFEDDHEEVDGIPSGSYGEQM